MSTLGERPALIEWVRAALKQLDETASCGEDTNKTSNEEEQ